ncbi:MAG: tetratricopeptide repeat protein [Pseudanabaena sp.]|jgi:tetratricopeptide (TPR) repeat protein
MSESQYSVNAQGANIGVIGDHAQVTQNIYLQSVDYQRLVEQIRDTQESLEEASKPERRLKLAGKLQELEEQLEEFKDNVYKLYEAFTKIEINTERLRQAKAYFDRGEFREADAVLKAEEMTEDLDKLIERERQLERQRENVRDSREQIANEFLIKARLWATFYDQSNRLEQTCEYFEEALRAARTGENLFEYALFLQEHYKLNQAEQLYQEALQIYRELAKQKPASFLPDVAMTLNNLAVLHRNTNEMAIALSEYRKALEIYRELAKQKPATFLPYVAMTLNNLAILHEITNEMEIALSEYREALEIYRELAKQNPATFLPDVAMTLNNLATLHEITNEMAIAPSEYTEALEIRRELAKQNPATFLPDVAMTLNNLAILHWNTNEMEIALSEYTEALEIRRELAKQNPATFGSSGFEGINV